MLRDYQRHHSTPAVLLVFVRLYVCLSDFSFVRLSVRVSLGFMTFVGLVVWQASDAHHHWSRLDISHIFRVVTLVGIV